MSINEPSVRKYAYWWGLIQWCSLLILFILHLPFLSADPDINLCCFSDAFQMEGLTTIQLRNYFNLGYLSVTEGDMFIKQPLFNLILFVPFKVFSTHLVVARVSVMMVTLGSVIAFAQISSFQKIIPFLCLTVLLQYHIFQYTHFAMPELTALGVILVSIAFLVRYTEHTRPSKHAIFFACLFSFLSCCMKILYFHMLFLVPLSLLLFQLTSSNTVAWRDLLYCVLWLTLFSFIYFLVWYLPNASFYHYVLTVQNAMRWDWQNDLYHIIYKNIRNNLLLPESRIFILLCLLMVPLGIWEWRKTTDVKFKMIFIAVSIWMILELHKLSYSYFPPRYQVSLFFSIGFTSCVVIHHVLFSVESGRRKKVIVSVLLAAFVLVNAMDYARLYSRKQYSIKEINEYMKRMVHDPNQAVLGVWGPAITWESKSRAVPVWDNFLNDKNTMINYRPVCAIIVEPGKESSVHPFTRQGMDLDIASDSVKQFMIGRINLNLYWIRNQE